MMFRSRKLLDSARGQECQAQLYCICNHNPETVVAAHSNWHEHGHAMSQKAHDCFVAWMCSACHAAIDQGNFLSREEKRDAWQRAHEKTLLAMFQQGILKVK